MFAKRATVTVQTLDGQTWDFQLSLTSQVNDLKKQIAAEKGVAANTQKLYTENSEAELQPSATLAIQFTSSADHLDLLAGRVEETLQLRMGFWGIRPRHCGQSSLGPCGEADWFNTCGKGIASVGWAFGNPTYPIVTPLEI